MILLILLLLSSNCQAGVNFAGLSGNDQAMMYDIPEFHSRGDAIKFANREGYSEQLRRALKRRMQWFRDLSDLGSHPTQYQIDMARYYASQYEYCEWALRIVENMKRVGSMIEWGVIPLNGGNFRKGIM